MVRATAAEPTTNETNSQQEGMHHPEVGSSFDARPRGVLSISPVEQDHDSLQCVLDDSVWTITRAHSWREASIHLCRERMAVIVCRDRLPDGDWRDVLSYIADLPNPPSVVVTYDSVDERVRFEVHELGGFEVLSKPFNAETVVHV